MAAANADPNTRLDGQVDLILVRHAESGNNVLAEQIRRAHGPDVMETTLIEQEARMRHPDCGLYERGHRHPDRRALTAILGRMRLQCPSMDVPKHRNEVLTCNNTGRLLPEHRWRKPFLNMSEARKHESD